ncbi:hypothetical protein OE749_03310 [Aestuariibacter sp. AA17]|uniref:Uncharacterized protein n=1 Tax=Fluctibacter corallii TaxID=2984329 RepID=A0ABT3A517_9ALTE|nr:DUF6776 family protein [Aestuariibacter sp. AA17]MCV2883730.1 hypothetical protein [Aestuariibacter sp. AA17]
MSLFSNWSPEALKAHHGAFKFYSIVLLLIVAAGYVGYQFGFSMQAAQQAQSATLQQSVTNLKQENDSLTKNLNIVGVELEVQKLAAEKAQRTISEGLEREAALKEQLTFYQKVMAPELREQGFVIDAFDVEPSVSDGFYRFDLVLLQQSKIKRAVKGSVTFSISGSQDGQPKRYNQTALLASEAKALAFSFKYFQVIEGQLRLPEGFVPEKVSIKADVYQYKKKQGQLEKTFDWRPISIDDTTL